MMNALSTQPTVCHVLLSLEVGGAEVLARQFAQSMRDRYRPVFACLDSLGTIGASLQEQGVPVRVLHRRPRFDTHCVRNLHRWFIEQNVRLVHAHQYTPFFYASLARVSVRAIPVLFTEHGRHYPDQRRERRVWANRLLIRRRDRVVAVSEHVRQALISNEGIAPDRVAVIRNGVNTDMFRANPERRSDIRRELGYSDEHEVVIQVARLNHLKDHATAIRAIAALRASRPQLRMMLVGDGELRGDLQEMVAQFDLASCVRFLGARNDVSRLLPAADVFLLSSLAEGIPLTLVEAMLSGVPSVATRVGGVPEVIEDGRHGLLADAGDAVGLADCLRRLLDDPPLRKRIVEAGLERARQLFGEASMLAQYDVVYRKMLRCTEGKIPARHPAQRLGPELALSGPSQIVDRDTD